MANIRVGERDTERDRDRERGEPSGCFYEAVAERELITGEFSFFGIFYTILIPIFGHIPPISYF